MKKIVIISFLLIILIGFSVFFIINLNREPDFTSIVSIVFKDHIGNPEDIIVNDPAQVADFINTISLVKKEACACEHVTEAIFVKPKGDVIRVLFCSHCFNIHMGRKTKRYKMPDAFFQKYSLLVEQHQKPEYILENNKLNEGKKNNPNEAIDKKSKKSFATAPEEFLSVSGGFGDHNIRIGEGLNFGITNDKKVSWQVFYSPKMLGPGGEKDLKKDEFEELVSKIKKVANQKIHKNAPKANRTIIIKLKVKFKEKKVFKTDKYTKTNKEFIDAFSKIVTKGIMSEYVEAHNQPVQSIPQQARDD